MVKKFKNISLTPTQAINKNKKFNNAAYMLAIGDNTDNPEFLYPEELMPSVVTANRQESDYKQAEKEAYTFRDRSLAGNIGTGLDQNLGDKSLQNITSTAIGLPLLMSNPATVALAEEMIVPALKHTGKVLLDPTKAYTGVGQALSTTADIYGTTIGLRDAGIGLNNIIQGNETAQDYLNVGLEALDPLGTFNALRAAKFNPLLRYTANMYTPNIKKSIHGNKVVSDIPDGYSESGNPVMVGNQVYQKYIDSKGKIVYKYLGYPSQLEASNVQNTVRTVEDTLPDPPEEVFINTLDDAPNINIVEDDILPDWVTQGNEPEIIPFRPNIDFSSARVPNSSRISTPNNRDIASEITEQIRINQVDAVLNNTVNNIDEIDEIINTATRNHPHSSYFARKEFMTELANRGLMEKYLEKQLGKPIQDIVENYVYDGQKFITKEEASNKLRALGYRDEAINSVLNDSKDDLRDFLNGRGLGFDFPKIRFNEPNFSQATHNKRIELAHLEDGKVINHLFDDNGALSQSGSKGKYIKKDYNFNDEDLELLEQLVNNYNKSANTNISVTDVLNNEDIMADLRNYLRSNYDYYGTKGTEFPGDINHMYWFQAGNSSGYRPSSNYKQVANEVSKDVADLINSIPRGYALGETNTSFDSEMLKLLYSLRSNNYGRGKGQISVEFNKKPNGIKIDDGNTSHKERIFAKDLYDKYKDKLSATDLEVLEEILNRGRRTKIDETNELAKKVSPELKAIIKSEYDQLGRTLSAKMQSVWDRLIQKDIELKDAPKIYPSDFIESVLHDFISVGNTTPYIHRPSIRIQKNKYGGKSKFKLGGIKEDKIFKLKGGVAIPLDKANKLFYLDGAKHEQGGIDITPELEAEGGEVVKINPKSIKVVTAQKIMGGKSPAELVVDASSTGKSEKVFNEVFNYQEDFKDRYNLNDDGTKKAKYGIIKNIFNKLKNKFTMGKDKKKAFLGINDEKLPKIESKSNLIGKAVQQNPNTNLAVSKSNSSINTNKLGLNTFDWINAGVNTLGTLLNFGHALGNAEIPALVYSDPITYTASKLNTRININNAKNKINRTANEIIDSINKNTADSSVARNLIRKVKLNERDSLIDLYVTKEKKENELINKDILNQQSARFKSITDYNTITKENAKNKYLARLQTQENVNDAISGLTQNLAEITTNIGNTLEQRNQFDKNLKVLGLTYPNLDVNRLNEVIYGDNTKSTKTKLSKEEKRTQKERERILYNARKNKIKMIRQGLIKPEDI